MPKNKIAHFWTVSSWQCEQGPQSRNFSIFASNVFLLRAKNMVTAHANDFSQERVQEYVGMMAKVAGIKLSPGQQLIHFGEWGVEQIDWPAGGGCWLALEKTSLNKKGATFSTHNVDSSTEQSFLMAVWLFWAQCVEIM